MSKTEVGTRMGTRKVSAEMAAKEAKWRENIEKYNKD